MFGPEVARDFLSRLTVALLHRHEVRLGMISQRRQVCRG
jgi:hypothetical protein